ncbi:unnamed protein product [Rotaria magnacalcarata]|uniref:LIM zinc-binding domain-containing protein n=1 Tax=Rotaria magnacalcarata TaxID=392030 RepID=A0A819DF23_9BILA|nr:unnamed protein product [Rotaria magnacalcarata]CAF2075929.1 unnamed protein product [Rotaria magnacalcarata]CAF3796279.1 unnamed protein product [Rotaria magnacalcarata]CAF3834521.1 unnamed protein product [Rotaria magnacalcarata]
MEEEYVSEIVLELQPRSHRGYRRLFGIRENKFFNKELFNRNDFTKDFINKYNRKVLQRGQHIECNNLMVEVKQVIRASSTFTGTTQIEFRLKGRPLAMGEKTCVNNKIIDNKGTLNESFINELLHKNRQTNIDIQVEQVYSCSCSECKKSLNQGDLYVKSGNWSRPILCLSCYDLLFTHKCARCNKLITFNHDSLTSDGLTYVRFVQHKEFYWHSDCCVCVTCLQSLIGLKFYQDQIYNQLFCLEHIPSQLE